MRSRRNDKLCVAHVQEQAQRQLLSVFATTDPGVKCTLAVLVKVVLLAAGRMLSIFAACLRLGNLSDQAVRDGLRKVLPKSWRRLQEKLNAQVLEPLPAKTRRRRRRLAMDVHEIPYHGQAKGKQVIGRKARSGTTKFFGYATVCIVERGHRYTLGYVWVRGGDTPDKIVEQLLGCVRRSGVRIKQLLLDRGFFSVAVMKRLQAEEVPFVLPVCFRGRRSKRGKKVTGLRTFLRQRAGWYSHTHRGQKQSVTTSICVSYKSYRHHRTGKRRNRKLVYAAWRVRATPTELREMYRKRFGIESSYRQLGQARIRTSTRDPLLRLFFVGVALLLRNLWVLLLWMLVAEQETPHEQRRAKRLQFKGLLFTMAKEFEDHLASALETPQGLMGNGLSS